MSVEIAKLEITKDTVVFVGLPPGIPEGIISEIRNVLNDTVGARGGAAVLLTGPISVSSITKTDAKWLANEIIAKLEPSVSQTVQCGRGPVSGQTNKTKVATFQ